jgi:hypothetical protein
MSAHYHTFVIACTIGLVYWWLHTPALNYYSLQAFAVSVVLYFVVKRFGHSKLWHIAPAYMSVEMTIATFAFLLLIGTTGNLDSPLYPLSYIHLFFLVLATHPTTSLIITLLLMLFHYAGNPTITLAQTTELVTLPILWLLFFFAKYQYQEVERDKKIIRQEEATIDDLAVSEAKLETFLAQFVVPKLGQIKQLAVYATENQAALLGQLELLKTEISTTLAGLQSPRPPRRVSELPQEPTLSPQGQTITTILDSMGEGQNGTDE